MRIAFIGFGEAGRAFRESLAATDPALSFAAYDILLDKEGAGGPCGQAMLACGVEIAVSAGQAVSEADWVFSAVTADQSLQAAKSVSPHLRAGQVLFDINSVSPQRKRDSADLLRATGADYVDMAVMAPVHPRGHRTPVLVAGSVEKARHGRPRESGLRLRNRRAAGRRRDCDQDGAQPVRERPGSHHGRDPACRRSVRMSRLHPEVTRRLLSRPRVSRFRRNTSSNARQGMASAAPPKCARARPRSTISGSMANSPKRSPMCRKGWAGFSRRRPVDRICAKLSSACLPCDAFEALERARQVFDPLPRMVRKQRITPASPCKRRVLGAPVIERISYTPAVAGSKERYKPAAVWSLKREGPSGRRFDRNW